MNYERIVSTLSILELWICFFFQAEDGIRDTDRSRGLGDVIRDRTTGVSAVLDPVKLIITNYPEGQVEEMEAINNPEDPEAGSPP